MAITISELSKLDTEKLTVGRNIYMRYFLDLYRGRSAEDLQLKTDTPSYLKHIFDTTEKTFLTETNFRAILAYVGDKPVGFCAFETIDQGILIRTLPIDLDHKHLELEIRAAFASYTRTHSTEGPVIIMVRKANFHHQQLCLQAGFTKENGILDKSEYLKNQYSADCYDAFLKFDSTL